MSKNQHRVIAGGNPASGISSFPRIQNGRCCFLFPMVGVTGFEPVTLRLSSACSNQLSYTPEPDRADGPYDPELVELRRFELLTYSLQSYRSTN